MKERTFEVWYVVNGEEEIELHEDVEDASQAEDLFWELHDGDDPRPEITKIIEVN